MLNFTDIKNSNIANKNIDKKPILVITFDDGLETDYTVAMPEMLARDMLGTTYLIPNRHNSPTTENYLNWTQIQEMYDNGWDMQCHSFDHTKLTELTSQEVEQQLIDVNNAFKNNNIPVPKHGAYPWGLYNERIIKILKKYRRTYRATIQNQQNIDDIDFYKINSYHADIETESKLNTFKNNLDNAITNNEIMVVYWHTLTETRQPYFIDFLDYAVNSGIETMTHKELYKEIFWRKWNGYKYSNLEQ